VSVYSLQTAGMDRTERIRWFQKHVPHSHSDKEGIVPLRFICEGAGDSMNHKTRHHSENGEPKDYKIREFYHQGHYMGGKE
jgi:hypothetical protein